MIVNTLLAVEYKFLKNYQISLEGYDCSRCYQLLGVDVILNSALEPNVIEISYKRCTYICTYVYTYTWVCMHVCMYVCMYVHAVTLWALQKFILVKIDCYIA